MAMTQPRIMGVRKSWAAINASCLLLLLFSCAAVARMNTRQIRQHQVVEGGDALQGAPITAQGEGWDIINSLFSFPPADVEVIEIEVEEPFFRSPPNIIDNHFLSDFFESFNLLQDVQPQGDKLFLSEQPIQFVAAIPQAIVEGEAGLVYDRSKNVYHETNMFPSPSTGFVKPMPQVTEPSEIADCVHHSSLATTIQKYGHMYYHFLEETIPKLALLLKVIPEDCKILMWGEPYEKDFLHRMGISPSRIVPYNATRTYCADVLYFPTPTQQILPSKESLMSTKKALDVPVVMESQRNLIIYVSREDAKERRVSNEAAILQSIREAYPHETVIKYLSNNSTLEDTIETFSHAKVVIGPHGAGLANMIFCGPNTSVVEFHFMKNPPMMFWHTAQALSMDYWLLPVPHSHWLQHKWEVPVDEVLQTLSLTTNLRRDIKLAQHEKASACPPGTTWIESSNGCLACPAGTFHFVGHGGSLNSSLHDCRPCPRGRFASQPGSQACRTCPLGTLARMEGSQSCQMCPSGTYSRIPGAHEETHCLSDEQNQAILEDQTQMARAMQKLSPIWRDLTRDRILMEDDGSEKSVVCLEAAAQSDPVLAQIYNRSPYVSPYLQPCNSEKLGANQTENAGSHSPVSSGDENTMASASKDFPSTASADEASMVTMTAMSGNTTSETDDLLGTLQTFLDEYVHAAEDRLKQSADGRNQHDVSLAIGNSSQATQVLTAEIRLDGASPGEVIHVDESLSPSTGGAGGSINGSITVSVVREDESSSSTDDAANATRSAMPQSTFPAVEALDGPEDTDFADQGSLPGFWATTTGIVPLVDESPDSPSNGSGLPSTPNMPQPTPMPVTNDGPSSTSDEVMTSEDTGDDDDSRARPSSLPAGVGAALLVTLCAKIAAEMYGVHV